MALGTFTLTTTAKQYISDGTIDLDTDTFKCAIVTSASNIAVGSTIYSALTSELTTANGYTAGGVTLTTPTYTAAVWKTANFSWTASGGNIVGRFLVFYKSGTANTIVNPILGFCLLDATPADLTITNGSTTTFQADPTNGWFKAV